MKKQRCVCTVSVTQNCQKYTWWIKNKLKNIHIQNDLSTQWHNMPWELMSGGAIFLWDFVFKCFEWVHFWPTSTTLVWRQSDSEETHFFFLPKTAFQVLQQCAFITHGIGAAPPPPLHAKGIKLNNYLQYPPPSWVLLLLLPDQYNSEHPKLFYTVIIVIGTRIFFFLFFFWEREWHCNNSILRNCDQSWNVDTTNTT